MVTVVESVKSRHRQITMSAVHNLVSQDHDISSGMFVLTISNGFLKPQIHERGAYCFTMTKITNQFVGYLCSIARMTITKVSRYTVFVYVLKCGRHNDHHSYQILLGDRKTR